MKIEKLYNKIIEDIKEYGYVIFNMDCISTRLENYSYNVSVQYNQNFSNVINIVVRNRVDSILMNKNVYIENLDYVLDLLNKEVF